MNKTIFKVIVCSALSCLLLIGETFAQVKFPDDLRYEGSPIDSLCFWAGIKNSKIDLKNCGAQHEKYRIKDKNTMLNKKGYIGYDWEDQSMRAGGEGYSYYRFYEAGDHHYWIYTVNNGGGSGDFTNLLLVKRIDPNTIVVQKIASGDRCNGGVQDVTINDAMLTFSINLTPYDLISLSNKKITHLSAYNDLAACAVCCVAKAFYKIKTNENPLFKYVEIDKISDISEMPTQGTYQNCLNELLMPYAKKYENILNQEKIDALTDQFMQACLDR